jgi:hypothetical protein
MVEVLETTTRAGFPGESSGAGSDAEGPEKIATAGLLPVWALREEMRRKSIWNEWQIVKLKSQRLSCD